MTDYASHDEYIDAAPEHFRTILLHLRASIRTAVPDAIEVVAYGMPGFRVGSTTVAGYAAFSKKCGLYLPAEAIAACADELTAAGLTFTKTGVTFTEKRPIPDALLTSLLAESQRTVGG